MTYKRLNNMTGMDKILNKRIASIFLNELETFRNDLIALPNEKNSESIKFNIHKIRPSMIIFELDFLLQQYESLAMRKAKEEKLNDQDEELVEVIEVTNNKIDQIREFIQSI
jgi:hypothetical protein